MPLPSLSLSALCVFIYFFGIFPCTLCARHREYRSNSTKSIKYSGKNRKFSTAAAETVSCSIHTYTMTHVRRKIEAAIICTYFLHLIYTAIVHKHIVYRYDSSNINTKLIIFAKIMSLSPLLCAKMCLSLLLMASHTA